MQFKKYYYIKIKLGEEESLRSQSKMTKRITAVLFEVIFS
jgi:hypothetical protein